MTTPLRAIADEVNDIDPGAETATAVFLAFVRVMRVSEISADHDEFTAIFAKKGTQLLNSGHQCVPCLGPLLDHIAAEKARCVRKASNNPQEDDAFGHLSRSRDWGMAEESAAERQAD